MRTITIGARGSKLSLIQAAMVQKQLQFLDKTLTIEINVIKTQGDKDMRPVPLDTIGKGWFTKELDKALLDGSIDLAVHSLKDIPEALPEGLILAAILEREDAREAFVSSDNKPFSKLKKGAVIGTDSTRRKAQILQKRPDVVVKSIRGNVNTRLAKLEQAEYDGIFLAVAGLKRLGLEHRITEYFSEDAMVPSPGQGALVVVCKKDNRKLLQLLKKINHKPTVLAVKAERAFSKTFGGGCKIPVGAYTKYEEKSLILTGYVGSNDGKHHVQETLKGRSSAPIALGKLLGERLLKKSKPWFAAETTKYVVITRPAQQNEHLQKQLERVGLQVYSFPTIKITNSILTKREKDALQNVTSFDWILFTSSNGVRYFMQEISKMGVSIAMLQKIRFGAVGPKTAEEAANYGLAIRTIPESFTTKALGKKFGSMRGEKVLLPRADIASDVLPELLRGKKAEVMEIPIYRTKVIPTSDKKFIDMCKSNQIACIMFTSPSTVMGFVKRIKGKDIFTLPVIAIGPVTAQAAREQGFQNIFTAAIYTTEGLVRKVKEVIL